MSGPKVVRVVTREEIIATCQGHLARVDAAIAEWMSVAHIRGAASQTEIEAMRERQRALHGLLTKDRFDELQKQALLEVSYVISEVSKLRERVTAAQMAARQAKRRSGQAARAVLQDLDKLGRNVPDELRRALTDDALLAEDVSAATARALRLLSPPAGTPRLTEAEQTLARQLGQGELRITLAEWLARQPIKDEPASLQIDQHLAELSALGGDASPFEKRASDLSGEQSPDRRALLSDSLIVELATALKVAREREVELTKLRARGAELAHINSMEARSLVVDIERALNTRDVTPSAALVARADALLADHTRKIAADARRRSILQGLSALGYEVAEGMATAWVEKGQVVLRKAANPGYGVELAGGVQSDRLQVRAIAFVTTGAVRDPRRDRDIETIWCGEFEKLQSLVGETGGVIAVEKAIPIGVAPLKTIEAIPSSIVETDVEMPIARDAKT